MATGDSRPRKRRYAETESITVSPGQQMNQSASDVQIVPNPSINTTNPDATMGPNPLAAPVSELRSMISCKVCFGFLYEPYTLSCGHTYCYSCIDSWFNPTHGRAFNKTCPTCRAAVVGQPSPCFVVREMTQYFISSIVLLPDGETLEDHRQRSFEESAIVEKAKANTDPRTGGLFKGRFKDTGPSGRGLEPMIDPADGILRCPMCHWEWEDEGEGCAHCGFLGPETDEEDDDFDEGELDETDMSDALGLDEDHEGWYDEMYQDNFHLPSQSHRLGLGMRLPSNQDLARAAFGAEDELSVGDNDDDSESSDNSNEGEEGLDSFIDDDDLNDSSEQSATSSDDQATADAGEVANSQDGANDSTDHEDEDSDETSRPIQSDRRAWALPHTITSANTSLIDRSRRRAGRPRVETDSEGGSSSLSDVSRPNSSASIFRTVNGGRDGGSDIRSRIRNTRRGIAIH